MSHLYARKADRDCPVRHALVNMLEDIDAAQMLLDAGQGQEAKAEVERAMSRFRPVANHGIRDLIVAVDLGRIRVTLDYADELGEMSLTYIATRR
jgi:hypothetical protein